MRLTSVPLNEIVPDHVLSGLSREELRQVKKVRRRPFTTLPDCVQSGVNNEGVWYVALATPYEYEVLQSAVVGEQELFSMLSFRLPRFVDGFVPHFGWDEESILWEQHMFRVASALYNPNLSVEGAAGLLDDLVESVPSHISESDAAGAVGRRISEGRRGFSGLPEPVRKVLSDFLHKYGFCETDFNGR